MSTLSPATNVVLSNYPLTLAFKDKLSKEVGHDAVWLTVSGLRQLSIPAMLRCLRIQKAETVYLPIDGDEGRSLLPILKLLAGLIPARRWSVIDQDLEQLSFSRISLIGQFLHLAHASATAYVNKLRTAKDLDTLARQPRSCPTATENVHVLFLNANLWFGVKAGGSVGHISGVVNGFIDLGRPVSYVAAGGPLLVKQGANYVPLESMSHFGLPIEYNYYRFHHQVVQQVEAMPAIQNAGFIYQRMSVCNFSGVELSRRLNKPLVLEYNGSEAWVAKNWGQPLRSQALAERCEEVALRHAHLVVTISDVLRDELMLRGVSAERIVSYPNCIDPETFNPGRFSAADRSALRERHGIPEDALVVTFVGTFGQWHGAPVLALAARIMLEQRAEWVAAKKLHFLFVGDGVRMPEVKAALGPQLQSPHVTMAGLVYQKDAPAYLSASDILSSPHVPNSDGSRFFGSPTKLFEYMAMGKAIIASDLEQIGEVLKGSVRVPFLPAPDELPQGSPTALLATPGSAEDIIAGLTFLAERPDWRVFLGENARQLALNKYTWHHHVRLILERAERLGLIT
jgi:glycosyltransferase involved in cell wall biosynthesis